MRTSDSLRIGDAERDAAIAALSRHYADGRLTQAEHEERMALALQARTGADLRVLFADLPRLDEPAPPARRSSGLGFRRVMQPVVSLLMVVTGVLLVLHIVPVILLLGLVFLATRFFFIGRVWRARGEQRPWCSGHSERASWYSDRPWRGDPPWRGGSGFYGR